MYNFQMKEQSMVELVFDDNLISFVKEIQRKYMKELIILSQYTTDIDSCMNIQEELREYMIRNQHKVTFSSPTFRLSKHPPSHPVMFALFIHIIADISLCNSINDAMLQIDNQSLNSPSRWLDYDADNIIKGTCGCGHGNINIENLYTVTNYETQFRCFVGCDCINKHELVTKDILKEFKRKVKESKYCVERAYQKANPDKRCDRCEKPHKNNHINRCDKCRKGRCDGCNTMITPIFDNCYPCLMRNLKK